MTDLAWGTVGYHLRRLEREGCVKRIRAGGANRYVGVGMRRGAALRRFILRQEDAKEILAHLRTVGAVGPTHVARALRIPIKRVNARLNELRSIGVVESDGAYRPRYRLLRS